MYFNIIIPDDVNVETVVSLTLEGVVLEIIAVENVETVVSSTLEGVVLEIIAVEKVVDEQCDNVGQEEVSSGIIVYPFRIMRDDTPSCTRVCSKAVYR